MKLRIFITVLLLLSPLPALSAEAHINGVVVGKNPELNVSFIVRNAFTEKIEEALQSGVATSFRFIIELNRTRRGWFDPDVGRWEFRHTVRYDTLRKEYEITRDERGGETIRTRDVFEMKEIMSRVDRIALKPVWQLEKGRGYSLRVMAELKTIRLPFLLDYALFFIRFFDVETGWYTHYFTF